MRQVIKENCNSPGTLFIVALVNDLISEGVSLYDALAFAAYKLAYYEPDTDVQTIRTPDRSLDDSAANCVDYTVLICCAASHFTDRIQFELVAYMPGNFGHVYPVIDGEIIDVVPEQDQTGQERINRRMNYFPKLASRTGQTLKPVEVQIFDLWNSKY